MARVEVAGPGTGAATIEGNGQLPPPPRRGVFGRVRGSLAVAVVFAVLAALCYLVALNGRSGVSVAVAARDLRPGETLDAGSLRYVEVSGPNALVEKLVSSDDVPALRGHVLAQSVTTGSPLSRDDVVAPAAAGQQRAMSIPVDAEHAAGGTIVVGDTVDVIDAGETGVSPSYAVTGVRVLAVSKSNGTSLGSPQGKSSITVALPDGPLADGEAALRLAAAIARGKVEVVRSTGAAPLPPAVTSSARGGR